MEEADFLGWRDERRRRQHSQPAARRCVVDVLNRDVAMVVGKMTGLR